MIKKKEILEKIYNGTHLSYKEAKSLFQNIFEKKIKSEEISAILIALKIKGENFEEIFAGIKIFLKNAKKFPRPKYLFADIVGTGGDKKNTINISTASAFIASGFPGVKIVKHGGKSSSGISGSADILSSFGMNLNMTPERSRNVLDNLGICFLFSANYHVIFKKIAYLRKILNTKTIFNIIGPLINPSKPPLALIGVYDEKLLLPFAEILKRLKYKKALVVHGEGTDEVILHGTTKVVELNKKGDITHYSLNAQDFDLKPQKINNFFVKSSKESFNLFKKILQGKGKKEHELIIAANVALLLKLFGYKDLKENIYIALKQIKSGNSYEKLISLVKESNIGIGQENV